MIPVGHILISLGLTAMVATPSLAQDKQSPLDAPVLTPQAVAPYDDKLLRLAEVMGSVHYLRTLCKAADGQEWRKIVQQILDSETKGEDARRERLTAAFNRGYRTFASVYTDCTPAAIVAEERYRNEGATLAGEITSRFGN